MKNIALYGAFIGLFCIGGILAENTSETVNAENLYLRRVTVIELDEEADKVTVEDDASNLWEFYGVEDWHTGDSCDLLMDDAGTMEIQDDIIVRIFYKAK